MAICMLAACGGGHHKKVVIMSNGKLTLDETKQKIKQDPGNTHTEEILEFTTDKVKLEVESSHGKKEFDLTEDGVYILNIKVDTLIGSIVNYGGSQKATSISGETLDRMIDSTRQMLEGKNVSDEKKTYWIIPNTIKKITTATNATILGPYKNIPSQVGVDGSGKPLEVYKFFTNKQKRETLDDMSKRLGR
jgi:hypothetical protein